MKLRLLSVWSALVWFTLSAPAMAQSPYQLDLRVDLPVLGLSSAIAFAGLLESVPPPRCSPACSPSRINALDRTVLDYRSDAAGAAADILLTVLLVAPPIVNAIDSGGRGWFEDTVVLAETLMVTQAITQLTKFAVQRNSPALYGNDESVSAAHDKDAARSFFSAHTASALAVTTAFTMTYWLRHPNDPMRYVLLALSTALSLTTGVLKVLAGAHFWTDVAAGALAGASVGVLVPLLHIAP